MRDKSALQITVTPASCDMVFVCVQVWFLFVPRACWCTMSILYVLYMKMLMARPKIPLFHQQQWKLAATGEQSSARPLLCHRSLSPEVYCCVCFVCAPVYVQYICVRWYK